MPRKPCERPHKIVSLKQVSLNRYGFSLSMGAWLVSGFTYNVSNGSMQMPYFTSGGRRAPLVKTFGIHIVRLRKQLDVLVEAHQDQLRENYERRRSEETGSEAGGSE